MVLIAVLVGILYWLRARGYESTDDAFIEGHVVQISPQVSARVLKFYIDQIDYQIALSQDKGNEAAALGKLQQAKASVDSSDRHSDQRLA